MLNNIHDSKIKEGLLNDNEYIFALVQLVTFEIVIKKITFELDDNLVPTALEFSS